MKTANKLAFLVLLLCNLIDWISYGIVFPFFPTMMFSTDLHFFSSDASDITRGFWLGILLAASPIAQLFSSTLVGAASDRHGRKNTLIVSCLVIILGYFVSSVGIWMQSLLYLLLGRVVTGIGAGNIPVVNSAIADICSGKEKTRFFAIMTMANGLGFMIGPFLGGLISKWGEFDKPFLFAGGLTFVNLILLMIFFKETHRTSKEIVHTLFFHLKHVAKTVRTPGLIFIFLSFFIFCFGWSFYWEFIPVTWIKNYHLDTAGIGNFYGYASGWYVISCAFFIYPVINRFQPPRILFVFWIILGVVILLLFKQTILWYWVLIPLQQYSLALIFPTGTTIVSNSTDKNEQGTALGVFQSFQSLAFAVTPLIGGILVGMDFNMPLFMGGGCILIASMILWIGFRRKILKL